MRATTGLLGGVEPGEVLRTACSLRQGVALTSGGLCIFAMGGLIFGVSAI